MTDSHQACKSVDDRYDGLWSGLLDPVVVASATAALSNPQWVQLVLILLAAIVVDTDAFGRIFLRLDHCLLRALESVLHKGTETEERLKGWPVVPLRNSGGGFVGGEIRAWSLIRYGTARYCTVQCGSCVS